MSFNVTGQRSLFGGAAKMESFVKGVTALRCAATL